MSKAKKVEMDAAEYRRYLAFVGKAHLTPEQTLEQFMDRIREEIEAQEMDLVSLADAVGMQTGHLRQLLLKRNPTVPKFTTFVKLAAGLNFVLIMKAVENE